MIGVAGLGSDVIARAHADLARAVIVIGVGGWRHR
jgi:hypothetical protein